MVSASTHREQRTPRPCAAPFGNRMVEKKTSEHRMKKVFICSPFRPVEKTREERERDWKRNIKLAKDACRYAAERGYIPYAPHLYFPQFLSEDDPGEREKGIFMGLTWLARCDEIWVAGFRISEGMSREIAFAQEWGIPIKAYVPFPGAGGKNGMNGANAGKNRVFDARFYTEEEFYKMLGGYDEYDGMNDEEEGRLYDEP